MCVDAITDKFGIAYTVTRTPLGANAMAYYAHTGDILVARAVLQVFKGCISDVLVYRQADRRRGIASALYKLIKDELGQPLRSLCARTRGSYKIPCAIAAQKGSESAILDVLILAGTPPPQASARRGHARAFSAVAAFQFSYPTGSMQLHPEA